MARKWTCRKCKWVNQRTASEKCALCGDKTKPKDYSKAKPNDSYAFYIELNQKIHGVGEVCAIEGCHKPPRTRNLDRDHDHRTGNPRGLLCVRHNRELMRGHTLESLKACAAYLERVKKFYESA